MTRRILVREVGIDINFNQKQRTITSALYKALTNFNGVLITKKIGHLRTKVTLWRIRVTTVGVDEG